MPLLKSIPLFFSLTLSALPMWGGLRESPEDSLKLKMIVVERSGLYPCAEDSPEEQEHERARAAAEFGQMRKDSGAFAIVASHLGFRPDAHFTKDDQLLLHCYYVRLQAVRLKPEGDRFKVVTGRDEELHIDASGRLTEMHTSLAVPSVSPPLREMSAPPAAPAGSAEPVIHSKLTAVAQRHHLIVHYGRLNSCGPMRPVSRGYGYDDMDQADPEAFAEIRRLRGLTSSLSDRAKSDALTEYEAMQSIRLDRLVEGFYFELNLARGSGMTTKIEGIVSPHGQVRELRRRKMAAVCPK